jgi:hypothetical protein
MSRRSSGRSPTLKPRKGEKKSKKPVRGRSREFIPADPAEPEKELPLQHRRAVARANALIAGRPPPPVEVDAADLTDARMDAVLAQAKANFDPSDLDSMVLLALARAGRQATKDHRRGARQPRKASAVAAQRRKALRQLFLELPSDLQKSHTGTATLARLRTDLIKKLGLPDKDDDLACLWPILNGLIGRAGCETSGRSRRSHERSRS